MMPVLGTAHQLAQEIKNSEEYQAFIHTKEILKNDEANYRIIRDFQMKQMEVQQAQLFGLEVTEEKQQEMERLYSLLSLNPAAREYLEAEFKISRLISDVQRIIGEAIIDALPIGFEDNEEPQVLS